MKYLTGRSQKEATKKIIIFLSETAIIDQRLHKFYMFRTRLAKIQKRLKICLNNRKHQMEMLEKAFEEERSAMIQ